MASILVIDDNTALCDVILMALERSGHRVWKATGGKEGLRLLQQNEIDVLITDVVMPEQDGIETLRLARQLRPDLCIIVMSGDSPRHAPLYLKIASQLGAHKTLLKPFTISTLLGAVNELIPPAPADAP